MKTAATKTHSKNRATATASSHKPGLKGAGSAVVATETVGMLMPVLKFGFQLAFFSFLGYIIVRAIKDKFEPMDYRRDLDAANISDDEAKIKADAIEAAYGWFGDNYDAVADALSTPLLNYNGFIKLYNAYGHRDNKNLIESIKDHFSDFEVQQLSIFVGGHFF